MTRHPPMVPCAAITNGRHFKDARQHKRVVGCRKKTCVKSQRVTDHDFLRTIRVAFHFPRCFQGVKRRERDII